MKKMLLVGMILICVFGLASIGFTFQNESDGFRGLKWGDPPTEGMVFVIKSEKRDFYIRSTDKMGIGNAKFYALGYGFYNGKFIQATGNFRNKENYDILEIICKGKFGDPGINRYYNLIWYGFKTIINLDYDTIKKEGYFSLISTEILGEMNNPEIQKEKEELEKAEGDF